MVNDVTPVYILYKGCYSEPMLPLFLIFLHSNFSEAKTKFALKESISVHMKLGGDLAGEYDMDGLLGSEIVAAADKPTAACGTKSYFRKVRYRSADALELWLTLDCTLEGQKRIYKPHRIFLDPKLSEQKIQLPMLAKNLKNVSLEFQNLSLVKSK